MFQRTVDTILQGLAHIQWFIDDILISDADDEEHVCKLGEVRGIMASEWNVENFPSWRTLECLGHRITNTYTGLQTSSKKAEGTKAKECLWV